MNKDNILKIINLERSYSTVLPGGEKKEYSVLKVISFQGRRGEFISIMGSSGCGKTTLLKTIGMLNKPNGGKILYNGEDTTEIYGDHLAKIRRTQLAFIFQDFYLMDSLTVRENIMLPLILNEDDPEESSKVAEKVAEKLGIKALLEKKPYELSGGEKQRIGIARAFLHDSPMLLLDEPTSNLDSLNEGIILKSLKEESKGRTVVLVSHRESTMGIADDVYHMDAGRVS